MLMVRAKRASGVSPSAVFVVSSRGSATLNLESPIFGKNCPVGIWLDGVPMYRGLDRNVEKTAFGSGGSSGGGRGGISEPPFDINSITTNHVAAIEFFPGQPRFLPFNATPRGRAAPW